MLGLTQAMDFIPFGGSFLSVGQKRTSKEGTYHAAVRPEPVEGQARDVGFVIWRLIGPNTTPDVRLIIIMVATQ
jgi:hypothetical protein